MPQDKARKREKKEKLRHNPLALDIVGDEDESKRDRRKGEMREKIRESKARGEVFVPDRLSKKILNVARAQLDEEEEAEAEEEADTSSRGDGVQFDEVVLEEEEVDDGEVERELEEITQEDEDNLRLFMQMWGGDTRKEDKQHMEDTGGVAYTLNLGEMIMQKIREKEGGGVVDDRPVLDPRVVECYHECVV